jgi:hypothetical protein
MRRAWIKAFAVLTLVVFMLTPSAFRAATPGITLLGKGRKSFCFSTLA